MDSPSQHRILVVRYSDRHGPPEGTIHAHQQVAERLGYVWFGKLGRPVGRGLLADLLRGEQSSAIAVLVTMINKAYAYYSCNLLGAAHEVPEAEADAIPDYYARYQIPPATWLKLSGIRKLRPETAGCITLFSSRVSLPQGLRTSPAGHLVGYADPELFVD